MTPSLRFVLVSILSFTAAVGATIARAQSDAGAAALAAGARPGATYSVDDHGSLVRSGPTPRRFDLGCTVTALQADATRLYVACGNRRVVVLAIEGDDPRVVGDVVLDADVASFFVRGSETWVELTDGHALALERAPVRLAAALEEPGRRVGGSSSEASPEAHVAGIDGLEVVLDEGTDAGFTIGTRVELVRDVEVAGDGTEERQLAVGEVVAVAPHRASVRLGVGEIVPVGTRARSTQSRRTASFVAPPRVGGVFEIAGTLRPYVALDAIGGGFLVDASVTYRATAPFYARASLDPSGAVLLADTTNGRQLQGSVVAGVDHRFVALGLGVAGVRYQTVTSICPPYTGTYTPCQARLDVNPRVGLVFDGRIGARDGLHLASTTTVVLVGREWKFGSNDTTLQVPLAYGAWLLLRGGTGTQHVGYSYATVGARFLTRGNGGHGSLFLTGGIGWLGASHTAANNGGYPTIDTVGGVSLSLGAEYRL